MTDEEPKKEMMRPNDLCTASYYGDLKKVKELLALEPVEEEPPIDPEFDPLAEPDVEAQEAAAERAAKRKANEEELERRLATNGPLITRLSLVNITKYGFGVQVDESEMQLTVKFKPSKRCQHTASPLHWAVLGKEHAVIEHLIMEGASTDAMTPELKVTIFDIAQRNDLKQTSKVIAQAMRARETLVADRDLKEAERRKVLDDREAQRQAALEEVRRKEEEERRREEEEAAAAEAEAAAEAAAEAEAEGAGDEEDQ